ncbi:MAG: undecaprenyl-diphosphate phosphatase [Verrucomicrobiota bacterium]|nr:undecaprenyl-diphosphate phosphatase [Verrucomicrobiota bacterium]
MPDWLQVILLGVIEGITEFLPISSTGHLLLAEKWMGERPEFFTIFIQTGAVLAVITVFRERIGGLIGKWKEKEPQEYLQKLGISFVITGIGGLALKQSGWELPNESTPIAWAMLIGGALFIAVELQQKKGEKAEEEKSKKEEITWIIAIAFGMAQLIAMVFPGASRSGTTILIGLVLGMKRREAVEFSFLLGVPTLLAAGGYELVSALKEDGATVQAEGKMLLLGTLVSAGTAFLAVKWLLGYLQRNSFTAFGWYRIAIGIAVLVLGGRSATG